MSVRRSGNFYVTNEDGVERRLTRVTKVVDAIKDTYNLDLWKQRMVLVGLSIKDDLYAQAASLSHDPESHKKALNEIAQAARDAGGSSVGSGLGTALHQFTENFDLGLSERVPAQWKDDIGAYTAALAEAGVSVVPGMVERTVIIDCLEVPMAGSFDRLYDVPWSDLPVIGDIKTGKSVEYGAGDFAMQLAAYAHASHIYNFGDTPDDDTTEPMPEVNRDEAVIVHMPAGQGSCRIYRLDISRGLEMMATAVKVMEWRKYAKRKSSGLLTPLEAGFEDPADEPATDPILDARRQWIKDVVGRIVDAGDPALTLLKAGWPDGVATLRQNPEPSHDDIDKIAAIATEAAAMGRLEFFDIDPGEPPKVTHGPKVPPATDPFAVFPNHDDNVPGDDDRVAALQERLEALAPDLRAAVVADAKRHGVPKLTGGTATEGHLGYVGQRVTQAESEMAERQATIAAHIGDLPASAEHLPVLACVLDAPGIDEAEALRAMTDVHVEMLGDMVDAIAAGIVDGPSLTTNERKLAEHFGDKRKATAAAKPLAEPRGRRVPTKFDHVAGDPVLAAAAWAHSSGAAA